MGRRLIVRPEAEADLTSAFEWYEGRRPGLGDEFLAEVTRCFERIDANPEVYGRIHRMYRRAVTNRFPFKVFYIVEQDYISVVAVLHGARHPDLWRTRIRRS